ncbi:MAG: hypothetical protein CEO40_134, partial [Parcubacteria group bacterium LiPW_72]
MLRKDVLVVNDVNDFITALKQSETNVVIYNGYICNCQISDRLRHAALDAIQNTQVLIIGCYECQDEDDIIRSRGRLYVTPYAAVDSYQSIVGKAINRVKEWKYRRIIKEFFAPPADYELPDTLKQDLSASLRTAIDRANILAFGNVSFYSEHDVDFSQNTLHFNHKLADGIVYCDENNVVWGYLKLKEIMPYQGTALQILFKKYDISVSYLARPEIYVHGIRKETGFDFGGDRHDWFVYRPFQGHRVRYSLHGDTTKTQ